MTKLEALKMIEQEFARREDAAWMPMQVFRSDEEVAKDEARHETWGEALEFVRVIIAQEQAQ